MFFLLPCQPSHPPPNKHHAAHVSGKVFADLWKGIQCKDLCLAVTILVGPADTAPDGKLLVLDRHGFGRLFNRRGLQCQDFVVSIFFHSFPGWEGAGMETQGRPPTCHHLFRLCRCSYKDFPALKLLLTDQQ